MTSPSSSPWLLSRGADLALFGGSTLAALLLLLVGHLSGGLHGDLPVGLWIATVVGVDVAHVWSTGWRVYADPEELARRRTLYLAIPAAAYGAGVVLHGLDPRVFWRVLAYTAAFHFVRQQYGWVALYRRRNGENDEPGPAASRRLDTATIYASTLAPLVFWHTAPPRRFHWFLEGDFAVGLPPLAGTLALWILALLLAAYAVKEASRLLRGRPVSWGKSLVVFSTALTWWLGIVVFDSDYAFTVTNVLTHGIPYFGLVYVTNRKAALDREARGAPPVLSDLGARSALAFLVPLLVVALLEEWGWDRLVWHDHGAFFPGPALDPGTALLSLIVPLLALPQATHYLLDAWIWKVRPENATAAAAIGLPTEPRP